MSDCPCFSIDKSSTRYFWCAWIRSSESSPDFSGYTRSKESAVQAAHESLKEYTAQAHQLKAEAASRWRGILQCKYCASKKLEVVDKGDRPCPGLRCTSCERFNKWLSQEQMELFQKLREPIC